MFYVGIKQGLLELYSQAKLAFGEAYFQFRLPLPAFLGSQFSCLSSLSSTHTFGLDHSLP